MDKNNLQMTGNTAQVMDLGDVAAKAAAFGWNVIDVEDGNDIDQLKEAFNTAKTVKGRPSVLIANTVKGKGSSVMEDKANWHHKVPSGEELAQIRKDLADRKEAALRG